ncbi:cytochrome c biogenesis protein DipZ [Conexibacter woesei]|uniref:cytochrome c biogenesis protein DipZ n=1 Tax=Conexibacter woesei TaxID=191495 RepID=UPI00040D574D|nr:redoxin family protein [Conexibacter woesei]
MVLLLVIAVVVGAGTALSPCALPVLPALLGAAGAAGGRRRPIAIVLGLSATFLLSVIGGGELLRHVGLGGNTLRDAGIVVLIVAGVAALVPGVAERVERPLASLSRLGPRTRGDGFWSGLLVGAALGFVYAPCAGPVLAAVASVSAVSGKTVLVAVAYVFGSAVVLAAIALGGRRVLEPIRRAGPLRVQRALGAVLLLTAVALAFGLDTNFETALARHTSDITLTAGLEQSQSTQKRLHDLHDTAPKFTDRSSSASASATRRSSLPKLGAAPEFADTQQWFNTQPLSMKALRGRVVLIDFWTYTCINCLRTLPYLEAWDARYRRQGLTIVGVHAPEFQFEHDAGNVARAIRSNHIKYPVVQDNDLGTWNAYGNQYWPADYLIDADGQVRATQFGEGDYAKTESEIRSLLAERGDRLSASRSRPHGVTPVGTQATPETYVGAERADGWIKRPSKGTKSYTAPANPPLNGFALGGTWNIADQPATAVSTGASITATVQARFVYLVLSPPRGHAGAVTVQVDGKTKHIAVTSQRLYTLADFGTTSVHTLKITFAPGTSAYAFTFG